MAQQRRYDVENQAEIIPLYPHLDATDGVQLSQNDLDRVWKPIFEDYNGGGGCCGGCTTRSLSIPISILKDLLVKMNQDEVQLLQQRMSRRTRTRVQQLQASGPTPLPRWAMDLIVEKADADHDGWIDYQEFCDVCLKNKKDLTPSHLIGLEKIVRISIKAVTPNFYDEYYTCCPPPLFIILISLVEIAVFVYYCVEIKVISLTGPSPIYSPMIYDPFRRYEAWRYLTYTFLHNGIVHIANNLVLQLAIGIPLEMVHKWWRVMLVYLLGSLMGCLAHSVTDFPTYLLGASGGVYALIGAHAANVIVNWKEMRFGVVRSIVLGLYILFDFGWALYQRYGKSTITNVGYVAHLGGFIGGLFLGIVCLKNFRVLKWERVTWWIALIGYFLLVIIAVSINAFYSGYYNSDWTPLPKYMEELWEKYGKTQ